MSRGYVPEAGDIVWLNFTPQAGHEQAGHRPALVLSPRPYNAKTNLMVCCPMTTQIKNYPFEVQIASTMPPSVVLADQIKSLDWRVRKATRRAWPRPTSWRMCALRFLHLLDNLTKDAKISGGGHEDRPQLFFRSMFYSSRSSHLVPNSCLAGRGCSILFI